MTEEWRAIPGYEGRYEVSSLGRVKSLAFSHPVRTRWGNITERQTKEKIRSQTFSGGRDGKRYLAVCLKVDGEKSTRYVHRLVCEAFHGPCPPDKHQCAHSDGNPENNRAENLRWVTIEENCADRDLHGTTPRGTSHSAAKLTQDAVDLIREINNSKYDHRFAGIFKVTTGAITSIRLGRSYKQ